MNRSASCLLRTRHMWRSTALTCTALLIAWGHTALAGMNVWTYRGPIAGTYIYIDALAIDPLTPTTLYAGAVDGGVFKSTDAGSTWIATDSGLTNPDVIALAIDPTDPRTLYAGTSAFGFDPAKALKSIDAGRTWHEIYIGADLEYISAFAIDPTTPTTLFATTSAGLFKSTDAGDTWRAANTGLPGLNSVGRLVIDPAAPATLYAETDAGVFKSTDAGATWRLLRLDSALRAANHPGEVRQ